MSLLYPAYNELVEFESVSHVSDTDQRQSFIDSCYSKIVDRLKYSASLHAPLRYKNYYKFWWSEELSCLKDNASKSNKIWKDAGRPRSGPIADLCNTDKRKYKRMLYSEREEKQCYTNDLHDALMSKSGARFWKCWKSKFDKGSGSSRFIDGLADDVQIAEAFAERFRKTCSSFNDDQNTHLQSNYQNRRQHMLAIHFWMIINLM